MIEIVRAGEILQRILAVQAFELFSSRPGVGSRAWGGKQGRRRALTPGIGTCRPRAGAVPGPFSLSWKAGLSPQPWEAGGSLPTLVALVVCFQTHRCLQAAVI